MKEYEMIELNNGNKYIAIDMLNINTKKYFLLAKILLDDIDNEFNICVFNEENNCFDRLEDEFEYNYIKETFENRLTELREKAKQPANNIPNIIKLKVIAINDDDYTLQKSNGEILELKIELYDDFKFKINDQIYIKEETTKEDITIRFGNIYTNETEIIKIIRNNELFYLQRYYG